MNTGPDAPGDRPAEGGRDPSEPDTLAEVFNRFTFGSDRRRRRQGSAQDKKNTELAQTFWPMHEPSDSETSKETTSTPVTHTKDSPDGEESATYIRPYAWTGGRTRSSHRLELETLVSTSELCKATRLERLEHHSVADLCRYPRSVAEVGALLCVPLGVARVLLGDMADLGLITVHRTVTENGSASHLLLMERVLSGLRRL